MAIDTDIWEDELMYIYAYIDTWAINGSCIKSTGTKIGRFIQSGEGIVRSRIILQRVLK